MVEIVNLKRARKAKAKAQKQKTAEANRLLHGTPKALRNLAKSDADKADQRLTGHRLEKPLEKPEDDNTSVGDSQSDQK